MGDMYVDGGYRNKQLVDNTAAATATAATAIVVVLSIVQFVSQIIYR